MRSFQRLDETALKARSQEKRLRTRAEAVSAANYAEHTLVLDTQDNTGECSCGRWAMTNRQHVLTPVDLKASHDLHRQMMSHPEQPATIDAKVSKANRPMPGTLPDRLLPLVNRLTKEALTHPAYEGMTSGEIEESVEHRLWSVLKSYPWWYAGGQPKKTMSDKQLKQLEHMRERKKAIQQEADAPYVRETNDVPENDEESE
ncbi:MAG: hypothetical protein JSR29_15870 [Nitrospira sp.]|nr:hypothetical protein [Nitrospira sp.]